MDTPTTHPSYRERPPLSPLLWPWLEEATRDLNDDARGRAIDEYADHFNADVEQRIAQGQDSVHAQQASLADLGSPATARAKLNKTNILRSELAWIDCEHPTQKYSGALAFILIISIDFIPKYLNSSFQITLLAAVSIFSALATPWWCGLLTTGAPFARESLKPKSVIRACKIAIFQQAGGILGLWGSAFVSLIFSRMSHDYLPCLLFTALACCGTPYFIQNALKFHRLAQKLRTLQGPIPS